MRLKARVRLGIDHIRLAAVEVFDGGQVKVVGVGNFAHKLAGLLAVLLFLLQALGPLLAGFVLALVGKLLDALVFLGRVFRGKRLVVFGNEALDLVAIQHHDFMGGGLGGFHLSLTIQAVLFFPFNVGVITLFLVVLDIFFGDLANEFADLVGRKRGDTVGGGHLRDRRRRSWRVLPQRNPGSESDNQQDEAGPHMSSYVLEIPTVPHTLGPRAPLNRDFG